MKQEQTRFNRAKLRHTPEDLRELGGKSQTNSVLVRGWTEGFDILTSKRVGTT